VINGKNYTHFSICGFYSKNTDNSIAPFRPYKSWISAAGILIIVHFCLFFATASSAAEKPSLSKDRLRGGQPLPLILKNKKEQTALDPGAPPKTKIKITESLSFGARLDMEASLEKNYNLDRKKPDDLSVLDPVLSLALLFKPSKNIEMFTNIEPYRRFVNDERQRKKSENRITILQAYISYKNFIDGFTLKVGRQRLKDKREWMYDEELDAVRLFYTLPSVLLDFSISQKRNKDLLNTGKDENAINYVFSGIYAPDKDSEFSAYMFVRDDRTGKYDNPIFLGAHLYVEDSDSFEYWLEFAHVKGWDGSKTLNGY